MMDVVYSYDIMINFVKSRQGVIMYCYGVRRCRLVPA
jgi:hypothetical protein